MSEPSEAKPKRRKQSTTKHMIEKLAPFSSTFTYAKGSKAAKKITIGGNRFEGHTSSCMKQLHEKRTILKEVKALSKALVNK